MLYRPFTLVWENIEVNPFPLPSENRLTASKSDAHHKTFDFCLFEDRWDWASTSSLVLGGMLPATSAGCNAGQGNWPLLLFPSLTYHQERPFQGGTCKKPAADEHMTKTCSILHSQTQSVCISSLVSSPSLNSGICWSYYSCFFYRTP